MTSLEPTARWPVGDRPLEDKKVRWNPDPCEAETAGRGIGAKAACSGRVLRAAGDLGKGRVINTQELAHLLVVGLLVLVA